jgi:hypothetical protein
VVQACNLSTREAEAKGSSSRLAWASLRPCLKNQSIAS